MDQRRAAGALLALAVCIASTAAAPTVSNHTVLDLYEGSPEGCYYNFQHYGEGDRIMTNEPCLNCTCHNRMLMCYLRVCPFTKPIGQDCTVEKRADQCCPIVTCPDVPVDLLTSTSTTSPAEYGATGVGKLDKYGCSINGKYFPEGAKVPPTPNKPCEHCYCIRNMTTCVMQECTLHVDGCTPIYHKDVCCPVRYSCDHPEDTTLFLDDMTTTVRPTPGFLLTTTTLSPVTQMSQDCVHDDQIFSDGALIKTEKACEHCYCMKGDIVCVVQECGMPMENEGKNCTSQTPREGQCCPDTYICEGDDFTTEPPSEFTTQSLLSAEELTTLTPPRRVGVEGSGYRKETEQPAETEAPSIETEPEGSGYEEPAEPAAVDENLASETPETITETIDESFYSSRTTVRTPILEEVEKTTEPDKGLNTVPSDASDEEIYKPTFTEKTPFEEPEVTEYTPTEDKKPDDGEEKTASPEEVFTQAVTVKSEESDITTETAFRKEDALGEPTEIYDLGEPENTSTQATYIEKDAEKDDTSSKTKAPFMEELEKQTTSPPLEFTQKDIEQETPSKESTTESVLEVATSAYVKPTEEISSKASTTESVLEVTTSAYVKPTDKLTTDATEPSETESTRPTVEKEDLPETTDSDQNEVEDISTTLPPGRIPGEGDCLLNDITYRNNSNVPSTNNCHTSCRCVSSIVKCDPIICSPPPEYMDNCQPTYDSPDACCPTYVCHTGETMPPQPHSQMSGTDSPLLPHPVVCHGDECAIRKDDIVPVVGDCGSAGCGEGHGIPETQPESCQDGKCSYPAQPCIDGNCQETPTAHCENGKCGIEPEIVPVKDKPLCENESDCKVTVPEVPLCDGEHCDGVNVGCAGTECSLDGTQQPSIPEQGGESCNEDCKTPEGETSEPCAETPCRRKESGEVDTAIPSECIGSECIQKVPSKKDDVNVISTESPVTEGTSAKSTQELEMTTKASEDASGYGPTEMDEHALDEGSTSGPLPEATVKPETSDDKYSGTEASTELDRTTESQLDKDVTKSPIEKESSTSEPPISVTGAITNEPEETASKIHEDSPVTESQDFTTKAQSQESIETGTTQHVMHSDSTESPHDTDDVRTAGPLEYSTSLPEIEDTNAELPHEEHTTKASEQQKPESELPQEPEKPDVYKVTEESVAYTPEMDMASTKLPESDVKQDVTESYAPQVTDTSHDVTESNEVVEKATKVPESVDSDEHKVTEMFQHEPTTEGATVVTGAQEQETVTSHATSSENDLEQAPFTNAPTESSLNDRTEITESVTEKITEASTASSSSRTTEDTSDLSSKSPEEYNTEKQDHFTESPGEYITEPQETSTKQPALAGEEPELTTDETIRETEQPTSDEDAQSQITSAPPVVDVKIKDDDLSSQTETKEEGTTQASVFEEKTTVSQPAEIPVLDDEKKQPTESFESNDVSEESSEKPAMTESLDSLTTKQPSKIPTYDDSTDVPATQDITDQQEISTEEPSLESVPPITDELPSEPYLPVHPETIPELPSAQTDITNEIPDTEQESQTPASDKEVEIETKIPDRSGLDEATKLPEIVDTESPEVKVPDTVKEEAATQAPEVYSETPAVHKEEETEPTRKPFETETSPAPVDEIPEKTPETMAPEQEEKDLVTTEKIQEQPLDNEQTSAPEIYATVSVVQDTTVSSVAQQETSEQPEVTESDISYATSAPESHVKEPQKPVSETAETYTTESHISDETSTEGSQEVSSGASEKPSEEKLSVYHGEQPEEKPEIQYERSTVLPEIITEAEQEVKPQEPQEEDKEDSVVTEPSPYKTTEAHIDIITSAISDQEKMTSDGLQETMTTLQESSTRTPSHDVTTSPDLEFPEKYTVAVTDEPVQQETSSPHADSTEKLLEVEDVEKQPTTLKTPLIDEAETSPEQVDKEVTKEPTLYETQSPDITEKESDAYSPATESSDKEQTTPEIVELEEHSHKPLEETSTVGVTEEEITDLQEHHFDEEKEKPQTEKPAAVTTSDEDGISTPSKEYSPEITKVTSDVGEIPSESTPRPSGEESGQDSNVPTTSQPTIEVGDTRFGDDTSQEEPQPTKASPESELTPVSEIEIPVQTERVPSEKITESELSHETLMLEEISPVTTKQEKESTTQGPEYSLPDVTPLVEKPEKEPSEKPEESSEKPSDEETVQSGEELEKRPSEETEKVPTESPLEEPAVTASEKPLTEEKPAETPEQKPLEEEIPAETPQKEAEGVTTETSLTESDKTPEEKLEEKPFEATEKTPVEEPTEGTDEKLAEKPDEQPEVRPVDESEEKPTEKPFDAEEKPLEAEEKPVESPEKKPQEIPDEEPLRTPEEKPSEMPEEKPLEIPEEKPLETPEEKPQEAEEKPQEYPEETSEVPTEKPLEVSEEQTQEAPEEKPQELPEEKPEEAPEEKPQDVPTETPQETLEQKPQEVPEEKPEEQPEEKPEEKIQVAPEGKPQLVPEEKPEEGAEEEPQETPEEKPLETPEEKPLETPEEKPLETPEEKPLETPEEKPLETPEEKPLETPEEKPLETPEEKPQESPEEKPLETPEEKPLETPEEKPLETPEEKPQEVPEEKPSELPEETTGVPTEKPLEEPIEKPAETPEMTTQVPDEKKQEIPEEKPEEIPEEKPLETPEEKPLETPEEKPQEVPEEKPSELPEETTGIPTEKPLEEPIEKPEETPEMTTQVPDKKKQETPEEEPEEIPEEKPQEVPETQPQEIPEEKPQELPEVPKEAPQEVPEEKPQEVPEEKPQESPKDKPEEIPEEKPEEKPQEEAEQKPQDVPEEKPAEPASTASPDISRPGFADMEPTDEVPDDFPPSGGTSGYGTEPEYVEEDQAFGPGTCRYGGKVYVSAQQIPRDDPCDFCFCFRSDIICLQQSCPPPIHGCHEEPIQGFCCPRYECPVAMATTLNVTTTTTTTTTTLPPHFLPHAYKGAAQRRGCQIKGHTYKVGEVVRASSGPCLHCTCGGDGQMKCDPKACTPEPMLRQMIAAAVSAKRRR